MAVRTVHASAEFSFRLQDRAKKFQCRKMKPCIPIFFPAMCKESIWERKERKTSQNWTNRVVFRSHTGWTHAHVPSRVDFTSYFPNMRKNLIFKLSKHSKVYKYPLEEDIRGQSEKIEENTRRTASQSTQKWVSIKIEDSPFNFFRSFIEFFMSCDYSDFEMFSFRIMN
ncbi:uncharacterized protein LOC128279384 [Gossypium arboreum]|uniref:uncharacterized protein LOC128279384 n=1 Tax=Gossypium arboreum TaxID=29729 RepID=UPI0022F1BF2A|nr:uncharacterized protein LOC128279384 [Gossypium arboreum]